MPSRLKAVRFNSYNFLKDNQKVNLEFVSSP